MNWIWFLDRGLVGSDFLFIVFGQYLGVGCLVWGFGFVDWLGLLCLCWVDLWGFVGIERGGVVMWNYREDLGLCFLEVVGLICL